LSSYSLLVNQSLLYLDRLRALAVLGVLVVHASQFSFANLKVTTNAEVAIFTILSAGRFGVEVFFLLSGFLLSYLYETGSYGKSNKQYFTARFFRIWPLWILFTVIWAIIYSYPIQDSPIVSVNSEWIMIGVVLSAFFLLWISPNHYDSFIGGAWSIQIEVIAYLIFALFRNKSIVTILTIAVLINLAGLGLAFTGDLGELDALSALRRLSFQTGFNFFVLGWLLARVYTRQRSLSERQNLSAGLLFQSFRFVFSGNELLLGVWMVSFLLTPAIYGNPVEAVGFVCLAIVVAQISSKNRLFARILEKTGKLSYFMFFMHFVVLHFANILIPVTDRPDSLAWVLVFTFGFIAILYLACVFPAMASLKYFEKPVLSLAKKTFH
jgi:peptidoglycan/LPS O-acetylase OafA/YrhL